MWFPQDVERIPFNMRILRASSARLCGDTEPYRKENWNLCLLMNVLKVRQAGFEACMPIIWTLPYKPLEYPLKTSLEYIQYRFARLFFRAGAQGPNGLVPPSIEWMKQWHRFLTPNPKKGVRSLTAQAHVGKLETSHRSRGVSSFKTSLPIYISTIDNKRSPLGK